jgi:ankyrin repeat protein
MMKRAIFIVIVFLCVYQAWAEDTYSNEKEKPEIIQLLLEAGYDLNEHTNYMTYTNSWDKLLWINAPLPFFEKLLLLGKSVEPDFGDGIYESPLVIAIERNNYEVVNFLISKGANVNREHQQKRTPLNFAAEEEDSRILRRLIEAGAVVNKPDEYGYTPLHRAGKNKENIEILLAHGANINAVDAQGLTPLMTAVRNPACTREIVQAFLSGQPNINVTDRNGQSALILAAKNTSWAEAEIITLLLNAGANAKLEDNTGRTALDWFDQNRRINQSPVRKELKDKM